MSLRAEAVRAVSGEPGPSCERVALNAGGPFLMRFPGGPQGPGEGSSSQGLTESLAEGLNLAVIHTLPRRKKHQGGESILLPFPLFNTPYLPSPPPQFIPRSHQTLPSPLSLSAPCGF